MEDILELRLVYNVWQFVLLGWGRYTLFKNQLRLPLGWVLVLVGALASACSGIWYFFLQEQMGYQIYRFVTIILLFCSSCLIIKAPFAKHALSYLTIFTVSTVLDTLSLYVDALFPNVPIPNLDTLVLLVVMPLALLPLIRAMRSVTQALSVIPNNRVWRYLCLCGFSAVLLCLTTTAHHQPDAELLLSRILLLATMIGMLASAVWIQKSMLASAETETALAISRSQVEMQQTYYDNLIAQMEEIRHIRHDLRHHRAALSAIIKNGDAQAAEAYINSWNVLDEATPVTGNLVADSLLNYYYARAKELDFTLQTEASLPQLPGISDHDLCVLMGNLLENALEAQTQLPPEQRFIRVRAKGDATSFTLAIDNRFDGVVKKEDDRYLTRKEEKDHGIGLSSVRTVCKKYNGVLQLETSGDLFLAGVVIGL